MSSIEFDILDQQLIATHKASGKPRYSNTLYLAGGGTICRWTDDRGEALSRREVAMDTPDVEAIITFDHWGEEPEIFDARTPALSRAEAMAELDEAIDRMIARWAQSIQH